MLAALALAVLLDVLLAATSGGPTWSLLQLPLMFAVSAIAICGVRRGGDRLFRSAGTAVASSLVLSTGVAALGTVPEVFSGGFGFTEGAALTLALVTCWRRAANRHHYMLTGAVALAIVILPARVGLSEETLFIETLAVVVVALAAATGSTLRASDGAHSAAVDSIRRDERSQIARELHDVVAHHVTGMVVLTQAARTVASPWSTHPAATTAGISSAEPPAVLDDALSAIESAGSEALVSLRSMVEVLRSVDDPKSQGLPLEPTPSAESLAEMVRRFRESSIVSQVDLTISPAAHHLPPQVQAAIHRIVQEALTNVSRYAAGAQRVRIDLTCDSGRTVLSVTDSGGRIDKASAGGERVPGAGGFGIVGMRERVEALDGYLFAGSSDTAGAAVRGWIVRAEIPA